MALGKYAVEGIARVGTGERTIIYAQQTNDAEGDAAQRHERTAGDAAPQEAIVSDAFLECGQQLFAHRRQWHGACAVRFQVAQLDDGFANLLFVVGLGKVGLEKSFQHMFLQPIGPFTEWTFFLRSR